LRKSSIGFQTLPSNWKMIEAEMYGMIPKPKIVASRRLLALNTATRSTKSPNPPCSVIAWPITSWLTVGNGM
jgi:hypothetical protein